MWIKQLHLKDFQAYKDQTLDLHPNVNVIVGTGNSGKSSIVRALSFILFGIWSSSWVRHGAKYARVTLVTDSGITIIREKGAKVNKYVVQEPGKKEQVYENFGKGVPEEIQKITRIFKVNIGDKEELNLNLANQLDQLFLLSNTGSFRAKVLGNLSKAHYLDYALRNINKHKKSANSEKSHLINEKKSLEEELKSFSHLDKIKVQLDSIEHQLRQIDISHKKLETLRELKDAADEWKVSYLRETSIKKKLDLLNVDAALGIFDRYERLDNLNILRQKTSEFITDYEKVRNDIETLTENRQQLSDKYLKLLKDNNMCPTCFNEVDAEKLEKVLNNA